MAEITIRQDVVFSVIAPRTSEVTRLITVRRAGRQLYQDRIDPRSMRSRETCVRRLRS